MSNGNQRRKNAGVRKASGKTSRSAGNDGVKRRLAFRARKPAEPEPPTPSNEPVIEVDVKALEAEFLAKLEAARTFKSRPSDLGLGKLRDAFPNALGQHRTVFGDLGQHRKLLGDRPKSLLAEIVDSIKPNDVVGDQLDALKGVIALDAIADKLDGTGALIDSIKLPDGMSKYSEKLAELSGVAAGADFAKSIKGIDVSGAADLVDGIKNIDGSVASNLVDNIKGVGVGADSARENWKNIDGASAFLSKVDEAPDGSASPFRSKIEEAFDDGAAEDTSGPHEERSHNLIDTFRAIGAGFRRWVASPEGKAFFDNVRRFNDGATELLKTFLETPLGTALVEEARAAKAEGREPNFGSVLFPQQTYLPIQPRRD